MSGAPTAGTGGSTFTTPGDRRPRGRPWDQVVLGTLLVVAGVLWLLDTTDSVSVRWRVVLPVALIAVGICSVVLALARGSSGLAGVGTVLAVAVVLSGVAPVRAGGGIGERQVRPTDTAELESAFRHGIGELTIDLRDLDLDEDVTVEGGLLIGELGVVVPEDVTVEVDASAGIGSVEALGRSSSGIASNLDERFDGEEGEPVLRLELSVGIGQVEVRR